MPGWHAKTKDLVAAGDLKVVGIVQEQHPDRAALFMQWHQMDWPVLADPFNLLQVKAVPYTFLIDEHGVIRYKNPKQADLEKFLATDYPAEPLGGGTGKLAFGESVAEHQLLYQPAARESVEQLERRAAENPEHALTRFRLGVAYRMIHDSPQREPGDFAKAVAAWRRALDMDPGQYIWRRRIQQYGPRLDKPYSFYDWVPRAREEIVARGDEPRRLGAEPGGAEFAERRDVAGAEPGEHPDPQVKLPPDSGKLVSAEVTVVPSTDTKKRAYRVHLRFTPDPEKKVHWTNDAGPLSFFLDGTGGAEVRDLPGPVSAPREEASSEVRSIEFEVRPAAGEEVPKLLTGTAFYYVCEDVDGQCLFLRQDVAIFLRRSDE